MWKAVMAYVEVWHLDATGSILKDIINQKSPYLYSIVFRDPIRRKIIPIFEFFTTSHTICSIKRFLSFFKDILDCYNIQLPKVIVIDFSWVSVNSLLKVFNNCEVIQYLNWSYDKLHEPSKCKFDMKVIIYLCSTHFLKNFIKKVNEKKANEIQKKTFIFSFALLQNSLSFSQFEEIFSNIFVLFNSPFFGFECQKSLILLRHSCLKANVTNIDNIDGTDSSKANKGKADKVLLSSENVIFDNSSDNVNLKKQSPFLKHFVSLKDSIQKIKINTCESKKENPFYNIELFDIIMNIIHLTPFWSSVLLDRLNDKNISRLTNNPVENWFGFIKHRVNNKNNNGPYMPSEYLSSIYKYLESAYFLNFSPEDEIDKTELINLDKNMNECKNSAKKQFKLKEIWKDKKITRKKKGYFYDKIDDFGFIDESNEELFKKGKHEDFEKCFNLNSLVSYLSSNNKQLDLPEIGDLASSKCLNKEFLAKCSIFMHDLKHMDFFANSDLMDYTSFLLHHSNTCEEIIKFLQSQALFTQEIEHNQIDFDVFTNIIPSFALAFQPMKTPKDGNCLWNMISIALTGDCKLTLLLKALTVFAMSKLRSEIERFIKNEYGWKDDIANSNKFEELLEIARQNGRYGTPFHIAVMCTFLGREIYIYNQFKTDGNLSKLSLSQLKTQFDSNNKIMGFHVRYKPINSHMFVCDFENQPIIGFFSTKDQHFTTLVPKEKIFLKFTPNLVWFH